MKKRSRPFDNPIPVEKPRPLPNMPSPVIDSAGPKRSSPSTPATDSARSSAAMSE